MGQLGFLLWEGKKKTKKPQNHHIQKLEKKNKQKTGQGVKYVKETILGFKEPQNQPDGKRR